MRENMALQCKYTIYKRKCSPKLEMRNDILALDERIECFAFERPIHIFIRTAKNGP